MLSLLPKSFATCRKERGVDANSNFLRGGVRLVLVALAGGCCKLSCTLLVV